MIDRENGKETCEIGGALANIEKAKVRGGIEDGVLAVIEPCAPKFDGAENLHVLAFSG